MKIVKTKPELCSGCGECMRACSKTLYKEENPQKSAIRIIKKEEESGHYEIKVCNHCGECVNLCDPMALYEAKGGAIRLQKEKCVGCYICVGFCPNEALFINNDLNEPIKCIACGSCTRVCHTGAIYMEEK